MWCVCVCVSVLPVIYSIFLYFVVEGGVYWSFREGVQGKDACAHNYRAFPPPFPSISTPVLSQKHNAPPPQISFIVGVDLVSPVFSPVYNVSTSTCTQTNFYWERERERQRQRETEFSPFLRRSVMLIMTVFWTTKSWMISRYMYKKCTCHMTFIARIRVYAQCM